MIKYEYKVSEIDIRNAEKTLNDFGNQGYELAFGTEVSATIIRLYLKRPVPTGKLALLSTQ
jgi:hypothetical protein